MSEELTVDETARRRVFDWIGYRRENNIAVESLSAGELVDVVKQLEVEVARLRVEKSLADLNTTELEALASETASSMLSAVHRREAEAKALAKDVVAKADKQGEKILAQTQRKADEILADAESRLQAAIKLAKETVDRAEAEASQIRHTVETETNALRASAEAHAQQVMSDATKWAESTRRAALGQANEIRRQVAGAIAASRDAHREVLDAHEKAKAASEKAQKLVTSAAEGLDNHAVELHAALQEIIDK
jgi:hypothetical protein